MKIESSSFMIKEIHVVHNFSVTFVGCHWSSSKSRWGELLRRVIAFYFYVSVLFISLYFLLLPFPPFCILRQHKCGSLDFRKTRGAACVLGHLLACGGLTCFGNPGYPTAFTRSCLKHTTFYTVFFEDSFINKYLHGKI